jgi:hypothetical protein
MFGSFSQSRNIDKILVEFNSAIGKNVQLIKKSKKGKKCGGNLEYIF